MNKTVFLLLIIVLSFSCDKINSKKKFFGDWEIQKKEKKDISGNWQDVTKECEKDDAESYRNMGVWYYYPGDIRCTPADNIVQGSWDYDKNSNRLVYTNTGSVNVADAQVEQIDKDNMVLIMNYADTASVRITYKKAK